MWRKLIIIAVVLGVIGAAAGGALYYVYPVQVSIFVGLTRNYVLSLVCTPRHDNYGIECGLQRRRGCCTLASRRGVIAERHRRRLAELQPNTRVGTLLAAQSDQYEECRQAEGFVHVRRRSVRCLRVRSDHGGERSDRHDRIRYFLPQPGDLRRELAHARGLPAQPSAGQPRRRLPGRHAVSRHPGRAGAGL